MEGNSNTPFLTHIIIGGVMRTTPKSWLNFIQFTQNFTQILPCKARRWLAVKKVKQQYHKTTYLEGLIHRWSCERRHEHHSSWNALWHRNHHIWAGPVGEELVLDPLDQPLLDEIDYEKYSLIAMISQAEKWCLTLNHVKRIVELKKVQILIMYNKNIKVMTD